MDDTNHNQTILSEGDIFYVMHDGKYHFYKLIAYDEGMDSYNVQAFDVVDTMPMIDDLPNMEVVVYFAPFARQAFKDPVVFTNQRVTADDLTGYHMYLKDQHTYEYRSYLANKYYQEGYDRTDLGDDLGAIDSYSKAIDLFPEFYQAIDNRAFAKMDLDMLEDAIEDFKLSRAQNPVSFLVEFSIGECYLKLGNYELAKQQFALAKDIEPNHPAVQQFLDKATALAG